MSPLRLNGSTSGYAELAASATAGDVILTLPSTAGTLDRTNRAGNILQVVSANYSTSTTNSTTTYSDTGLTASITPSSSSNKILVLVAQNGLYKSAGDATNGVQLKLFRSSTELALAYAVGYTATALQLYPGSVSFCYLDSPATASSVTYKTQFANIIAASTVAVQADNSTSQITLLEVAA